MDPRQARVRLLFDREHYETLVLGLVRGVRTSLWIATANLKELMVEAPIGTRARARGRYVSIVEDLRALIARGVDVRLLHASPPSGPMTRSIGGDETLRSRMRMCPRVHLKVLAADGAWLYLGSANFTGRPRRQERRAPQLRARGPHRGRRAPRRDAGALRAHLARQGMCILQASQRVPQAH